MIPLWPGGGRRSLVSVFVGRGLSPGADGSLPPSKERRLWHCPLLLECAAGLWCSCYGFLPPGSLQPTAVVPPGEPTRERWQCHIFLPRYRKIVVPPASPSSTKAARSPLSAEGPCGWAQGMAALLGHVQSRGVPISSLTAQASRGSLCSCPARGTSAAAAGDPVSGVWPCAEGRWIWEVKRLPVSGKMCSRNSWRLHLAEW